MPIVTYYDKEIDKYIIVDGFHRYTVLLKLKIEEIPVSIIDKTINERRISTIRHNKAKGTHQLSLIKENFNQLLSDKNFTIIDISEKLGLEAEEIIIYKRGVSVASDMGKDVDFSNSWERNPDDKIMYKNKKYNEYEKD
jgi:ParB-like chromosome segregation protein Spo0J